MKNTGSHSKRNWNIFGSIGIAASRLIFSPKASFWDWTLRQRFEQSYCEFQIGVMLGDDAKMAAACSQATIRTASRKRKIACASIPTLTTSRPSDA